MPEKARILLVDDEPSLVKMVGRRLELAGYEVLTAEDGQQGLAKAQSERPDLIILDIMMPKLNGYEVCRQLKQNPHYQEIPILVLTAKVRPADQEMAMRCGADVFMRKPFRADELMEAVQRLLAPPA